MTDCVGDTTSGAVATPDCEVEEVQIRNMWTGSFYVKSNILPIKNDFCLPLCFKFCLTAGPCAPNMCHFSRMPSRTTDTL